MEENNRLREDLERARDDLANARRTATRAEERADKLASDYWPQVTFLSTNMSHVASALQKIVALLEGNAK